MPNFMYYTAKFAESSLIYNFSEDKEVRNT